MQAVDEAAAGGVEVDGGRAIEAEGVGDEARRGRGHHVGRDGRHEDEIEVLGLEVGVLEPPCRRPAGQHARRLVAGRDASLLDAGPLDDPLVVGVASLANSSSVIRRSGK